MIATQLSSEVQRLIDAQEPFVLATVVRARRPTSVRAGDAAVVHRDGSIEGFVGGVCAESSVRLHSLRALETGEPLLLALVPGAGETGDDRDATDGAVVEHNPCLSGGALEIFLEPHLPAARVIIVGGSPIALAIEALAATAGYDCRRITAASEHDLSGAAAVIVASHGNAEESVLVAALSSGVPYVALVASPKRGSAVRSGLEIDPELRRQLHTPAGIDIGARTPQEIAISILAQLVARQHLDPATGQPPVNDLSAPPASQPGPPPASQSDPPPALNVAVDPICGMKVAASPATSQLSVDGETVYFCGPGCQAHYAAQHVDELSR
jgi:xanthine dehydrogenase accessory factor